MKHTVLIVPAWSGQAGQCRIVACESSVPKALQDYRERPDAWEEVGLMNSQGKLVCLKDIGDLRQQMLECEPLAGGLTFQVED